MKVCFKCSFEKPYSDFYKHGQTADGYLNKCKDCTKSDVRNHRRENESVREYDRKQSKTSRRKALSESIVKRWRAENPEKYKAQTMVGNYLRGGKIEKKPCEVCGEPRVHAHHDDYSKPLEIRWLCALHHHRHHAKVRNV